MMDSQIPAAVAFALLIVILLIVASRRGAIERGPNVTR
jgi:hypothetical protein